MLKYSIRPKSNPDVAWKDYSRAALGISLSNSNERGEKFMSIVHWLNSNFDEIIIDLSDTLYRWNEYDANGCLLPDAMERAKAKGDLWIADNLNAFQELKIPYKLIRWNSWLDHPDFDSHLKAFHALYSANESFRHVVANDVKNFLDRQRKSGNFINQRAVENCFNFVFEELTAHTLLFKTYPSTLIVYPGGALGSSEAIRQNQISNAPLGLQNIPFISLRIEKTRANQKTADKPQFDKLVA